MAYVEVEVDLDEFDDDEIFDEAILRINRAKKVSSKDKLMQVLQPYIDEFASAGLSIKTYDDKAKLEHISKIWDKYTSFEIEKLIPE